MSVITLLNILTSIALAAPGKQSAKVAPELLQEFNLPQPQNCVNPGGGCNGSVPCCGSEVNACVRGFCEPVPENPYGERGLICQE